MTENQKEKILEMRRMGCSYRHVATTLALREGTVKSFCLRSERKGPSTPPRPKQETCCKHCGKPVEPVPKRKKKIFCSKTCRQGWWNSHLYLVNPTAKALHEFTCIHCGTTFTAYGNARRKYCSHECYIQHRYYKGNADDR
ncbi:MAG: RNA polymerase subunit sigma-70 [Candidatus Cloacimonetes bacterium]|nr:RNA polymerase subunit sigma-70 [Candidatus Cloacimonadota bacterium]